MGGRQEYCSQVIDVNLMLLARVEATLSYVKHPVLTSSTRVCILRVRARIIIKY